MAKLKKEDETVQVASKSDPLAIALAHDDEQTRLEALNTLVSRARRSQDPREIVRPFGYRDYAAAVATRDTLATRISNRRYQQRLAARGEKLVTVAAPAASAEELKAFARWLSFRDGACE
jgi:hypothetical protein